MLRKSSLRRTSAVSLQGLLVMSVVAAGVVSMMLPECQKHTQQLTFDGVAVGCLSAILQFLVMLTRRPDPFTVGSALTLSRSLVIHHVKFGIVGGYVFGVTSAVAHCLFGW
jgi:hypothetical protein